MDFCSEVIKAAGETLLEYMFMNSPTDLQNEVLPAEDFVLYQNYPNPFNPNTVISYQLPVTGYVILKVYDVLGNEIAVLVDEEKSAGSYEVNFDGINLSSVVYIYKLETGLFIQTKKMILMK
jgi:hypothetical protein